MSRLRLAIAFLALAWCSVAAATVPVVLAGEGRQSLWAGLDVLPDPDGHMDFEDVRRAYAEGRFAAVPPGSAGLGYL
ncbi:MAG: hypothetical protein JNM82_10625, partial [Rhodocyclaceae bacterium]|nr:hypothetical protein [Rhodocyclaceae bacterium]